MFWTLKTGEIVPRWRWLNLPNWGYPSSTLEMVVFYPIFETYIPVCNPDISATRAIRYGWTSLRVKVSR
jgi:hypothetical protein